MSKVLVICAQEEFCSFLAYLMDYGGYRTCCVSDFEQAGKAIGEELPDAVIVYSPIGNSLVPEHLELQAVSEWRALHARVPVLLLVGRLPWHDRELAYERFDRVFELESSQFCIEGILAALGELAPADDPC